MCDSSGYGTIHTLWFHSPSRNVASLVTSFPKEIENARASYSEAPFLRFAHKKIWQTVNTSDPGPSNPQHMSTNGDWAWMSLRAGSKQLWQAFIISAVFSDLWPTYGESAPAHCAYHRASVSNIIADIWFQLKWLQNTFWQALNPIPPKSKILALRHLCIFWLAGVVKP